MSKRRIRTVSDLPKNPLFVSAAKNDLPLCESGGKVSRRAWVALKDNGVEATEPMSFRPRVEGCSLSD